MLSGNKLSLIAVLSMTTLPVVAMDYSLFNTCITTCTSGAVSFALGFAVKRLVDLGLTHTTPSEELIRFMRSRGWSIGLAAALVFPICNVFSKMKQEMAQPKPHSTQQDGANVPSIIGKVMSLSAPFIAGLYGTLYGMDFARCYADFNRYRA